MKQGEAPEEALVRELHEETGFQIEVIRVLGVDADKVYSRMDLLFEAKLIGGEFCASEEVSEVGFFAVDPIYQRFTYPERPSAATINLR